MNIFGYDVTFQRRRYGTGAFFCWANVIINGEAHSVGDPYPAVNWKRSDLESAVRRTLEKNGVDIPRKTASVS